MTVTAGAVFYIFDPSEPLIHSCIAHYVEVVITYKQLFMSCEDKIGHSSEFSKLPKFKCRKNNNVKTRAVNQWLSKWGAAAPLEGRQGALGEPQKIRK